MAREDEILEELKRLNKSSAKGGSSPTGPSVKLPGAGEFNIFNTALGGAGKAADAVKDAYNKVAPGIEKGLDTWRELSKVGAGFSNDVVGMTVAAAGTRMPLQEFAGIIGKNAESMLGFGGTVTRGAEDFAKMSKRMFDEYGTQTDQLRQMGYTNKELNEILLMQGSIQRGSFKDEQSRNKATIESATKLATEMDEMAKLTGKSREEQMANMKKAQADMQFEAAIRLKTQGMSAEDAKKFEDNARKQMSEAQLRGQGQMFKEVFATGQIMSKEAAIQASLNQEQAAATRKQAQVSGDAKLTADQREMQANAAAAEGRRAAAADMNNTAKLQLMTLGDAGGAASKALNESAGAQIQQVRGLEAIAAANKLNMDTDEGRREAQRIQNEEIKKSQEGKNKEGDSVSGATKAVVNLGARVGDAESAIANKLVLPLNRDVSPALGRFADRLLGSKSEALPASATKAGQSLPQYMESELDKGRTSDRPKGMLQTAGKMGKDAAEGINKVLPRSGGTYGDGITSEAVGSILEITKPGEVVLNPEQQMNMAKGLTDMGAEKALSGLANVLPKQSASPPMSFDLGKISKDINTSVSGGGSSTISPSNLDMAEMMKPFDKSFDEFGSNFDDVIAKMSNDIGTTMPTDMFDEFGSNFDDVMAKMSADLQDAMPIDSIDQTANALEFASKRRQELEDIMNDGIARSGAEWDEIFDEAEQLDGQIEKLTNKQLESISKYADGWDESGDIMDRVSADILDAIPLDEFGDLDGAIAKQQAMSDMGEFAGVDEAVAKQGAMADMVSATSPTASGIDIGNISFGPNGMPIMGQTKAAAATIPAKPVEKTAEEQAKEKKDQQKTDAEKGGSAGDKSAKPSAAAGGTKEASMSDMLASLNQLNTKMAQLITVTETGHKDVAKATKSNNPNLFKA